MADLFISYSRQSDTEFVDRLTAALAVRGQDVWVDRTGIFPSSPFLPEIEQAILEAHAFAFVISPSSVASDYCRAELDRATGLGKRIVPILAIATASESIPPELAELQFFSFTDFQTGGREDEGGFERQVDRLVEVLSTDIESLHLQTRLLTQSSRWAQQNEDRSLLLRGRELDAAERWLDAQNAQGRLVLPDQQRLVRESRRASSRRQRGSIGTASVIAIAMALLAVFALVQRGQAVHQSNVALGRALAAESVAASTSNVTNQGLLGLEAYTHSETAQARSALVGAAEEPLETTLPASLGEVNGVAYDPKANLLATASARGAALWSTRSDEMQGQPFDAGQQVNWVAFSPGGAVIATALSNGTVALFKVSSHKSDGILEANGSPVTSVAFAPDGFAVAGVTFNGTIFLWNLATGKSNYVSVGSGRGLLSVAFSHDGSTLAVGGDFAVENVDGYDGFVDIYPISLQSPKTFVMEDVTIHNLAFSPNGRIVAVTADNNHVLLLNPLDDKQIGQIQLAGEGQAVAFNRSGSLVATGDTQGSVQLWKTSSFEEVGAPMEDGSIVYGLDFSADGASLASGDLAGNVLVWTTTGRPPQAQAVGGPGVLQLSISSDSKLLATVNDDGSVTVRSLSSRKRPLQLPALGAPLSTAAFAPRDANLLAIGDLAGDVFLYDTRSGQFIPHRGEGSAANDLVFSHDDRYLAVGHANGNVALWELKSERVVANLRAPEVSGGVTAMAFSPDSKELVVAFQNIGMEAFHPGAPHQDGTPVQSDEHVYSLAFSPNSTTLAAGDVNGNVELYAGPDLRSNGSLPGDGSKINGVAISPDGDTLATMDKDGNFRLWDLHTRQQLGSVVRTGSVGVGITLNGAVLGSPGVDVGISFAPNGDFLATAGQAGAVVWPSLLWSTDVEGFHHDLCPRLAQNLTRVQWKQYVSGQPYDQTCTRYPVG